MNAGFRGHGMGGLQDDDGGGFERGTTEQVSVGTEYNLLIDESDPIKRPETGSGAEGLRVESGEVGGLSPSSTDACTLGSTFEEHIGQCLRFSRSR